MKEKRDRKTDKFQAKDYMMMTLGLILVCLSIITATSKTVIGSFFTYIFAYVLGSFYPVFLILLFLYGIRLIIVRKGYGWKDKATLKLGIMLLLLSALALGSAPILKEDPSISFANFSLSYTTRFKSFAHAPFVIDNMSFLSSLAGGYIGLFLSSLLVAPLKVLGVEILYFILLSIAICLILVKPIIEIVSLISHKLHSRIEYSSPYKGESKKEEKVDIPSEVKQPLNQNGSFIQTGRGKFVSSTTTNIPIKRATIAVQEEEKEVVTPKVFVTPEKVIKEEPSFSRVVEQKDEELQSQPEEVIPTPIYRKEDKNKDIDESLSRQAKAFYQGAKGPDKTTFDVREDPIIPTRVVEVKPTPIISTPIKEEPVVEKEPIVVESPFTESRVERRVPYQDPTPIISTPMEEEPYIEEEEIEEVKPIAEPIKSQPVRNDPITMNSFYQSRKVNPLEAVARNVSLKENSENTYRVNTPKTEKKPVEVEQVKSQEELDRDTEKRYFTEKQRKAIEAIQAKQREKNERKAKLMRFVSDVPRFYNYPLPTDELLEEHDDSAKMVRNNESAEDKVRIINSVFNDYDVKAKVTSFTVGASVTRFNVETEPGERSDRISSLVDELQKSLNGDKSVRVETVVEGRNTSGIEVGNSSPMAVSFKDVFQNVEVNTTDNLLLPIGKDISGNIITYPLDQMPHLLVAGTTGSGKSVLVHSMIVTLMMRNYPSQMKLILIDPKQVEFVRYQECSHLFCPVISKPEAAVLALKKLCDEMDKRFNLLSKYKVANLDAYNQLRTNREALYPEMPHLVCVIDEFADLMMVGGKEVAMYVQRIGQKARAAGIHMIIATQRPSKDNVPMMIKANVPCRIGLSCSSQVDSRVILDENGAETLLGKGDLLFKCPAKKSLIRAQSPFLSDEEIDKVLFYIKQSAGDPVYDREFLELEEMANEDTSDSYIDPAKKLYEDIKDFVVHTGITTKESIMRNFQVSSSKADTYLATMVSEGILMMAYDGGYILGPAAADVLQGDDR